jgi:uncharacterized protein
MGVWLWIIGVIFVLFVLYFGVGWVAAITLTRVGDHPQFDQTPGSFGLNYQTVQISSRGDRFRLSAWYIPHDDVRGAIILVHGRDASKQNAISGKLPKLAAQLHGAGLTVLMLDMRGHGQSEGKRYTWGVYERRDVLGAVDYLLDQGFVPGEIAALGISLGGAAVAGAAFEEPSIGALVLDSTFADLETLVRPNWRKESGLPMLFLPSVFMMWQAYYRFDLRMVKPVQELAQMPPRPVLVLHSRTDETVPVDHGIQLAEAAPQGKLVLFEDGEHAELFRDAPEMYLQALVQFLKEKWLVP